MRPISNWEFESELRPRLKAVFRSLDPFDEPFEAGVQPRLLLYKFSYTLQEPWLSPFVSGLKSICESGFYVSILGWEAAIDQQTPYHWYVPLNEAGQYIESVGSTENIIYGPSFGWGIICSDEDHAILGGSETLVRAIGEAIQDLGERLRKFVDLWRYYHENNNVAIDWLPGMLRHVYGQAMARELLDEAGLTEIF